MRHAGGLARAPEAALEALAEAPVPFVSAGITYDGGSPLITTFDSGPAVPYDSPFWLPAAENAAIIDSTHTLATLSGAAGASSFTTGDIGDESQYVLCDRFQVRYLQAPASATCSGTLRDDSGGAQQAGSVAARSDGSFDVRQSARWHRFLVATTGECEFTAIGARLKPAGTR